MIHSRLFFKPNEFRSLRDYMKLFKKKAGWRLVIIHTDGVYGHDLNRVAWNAADCLCDKMHAPLYFAHYSTPNGESRVEIKVKLTWSLKQFQDFFREEYCLAASHRIEVKPFNGSLEHAQAYLLSRELRGKGDVLTSDVLHWLMNMTGYSYAQEIRVLAAHVAAMACNLG